MTTKKTAKKTAKKTTTKTKLTKYLVSEDGCCYGVFSAESAEKAIDAAIDDGEEEYVATTVYVVPLSLCAKFERAKPVKPASRFIKVSP